MAKNKAVQLTDAEIAEAIRDRYPDASVVTFYVNESSFEVKSVNGLTTTEFSSVTKERTRAVKLRG